MFAPTTPESAPSTGVFVKVWVAPHVLEVEVPKASEMLGVFPPEETIGYAPETFVTAEVRYVLVSSANVFAPVIFTKAGDAYERPESDWRLLERFKVPEAPPTSEPRVPEYDKPEPSESVVVAAPASEFVPLQYASEPWEPLPILVRYAPAGAAPIELYEMVSGEEPLKEEPLAAPLPVLLKVTALDTEPAEPPILSDEVATW